MIFDNKRCETEIIYDLLSSAQTDIKKTHLMYKTNMKYTQFTKYLDVLLEKGLLGEKDLEHDGKTYYVTDKGKKFLSSIETAMTYLK